MDRFCLEPFVVTALQTWWVLFVSINPCWIRHLDSRNLRSWQTIVVSLLHYIGIGKRCKMRSDSPRVTRTRCIPWGKYIKEGITSEEFVGTLNVIYAIEVDKWFFDEWWKKHWLLFLELKFWIDAIKQFEPNIYYFHIFCSKFVNWCGWKAILFTSNCSIFKLINFLLCLPLMFVKSCSVDFKM